VDDDDGVVGAAWIPSDGYIDPYSLTQAYAKAARAGGATIREGVLATASNKTAAGNGGGDDHGTIAARSSSTPPDPGRSASA
jgi:4-methylaminobutanoate oxidase (formaldehyde-forming)